MAGSLRSVSTLALAFGAFSFVPSQPAFAQQGHVQDDNFGEIIVTARSREETLLEAPLSITAFSGDALEEQQIDSMEDLAAMTPGLIFQQAASATSSRPVMRGMTQTSRASGDVANTGVFIDGVYSPGMSGVDMSFVGLERVEVVRGPQSAAYGRNTFAGAVNYITKRPSHELTYGGSFTAGEYDMIGATVYGSGPITDNLAVRLDAAANVRGGYFENQATGDRLNDSDSSMVRLGLLYQPTANIDIYASYSHYEEETTPSPLIVVADTDPRRIGIPPGSRNPVGRRLGGEITDYTESYSFDPLAGGERESDRYSLVADFDFGGLTLSSRTGYEERTVATLVDLDQTPAGTDFGGAYGVHQTASGDWEDRWEFSQDFRLQPSQQHRFNWIVGAYYSYERNQRADVRTCDPTLFVSGRSGSYYACEEPVNGSALIDEEFLLRNIFHSVYASVDYAITDQITFTMEGRNTWERKRETVLQNNYGSDSNTTPPFGTDFTTEFEYFTPRFILEYEPSDSLNFYAQAAKGTKSGGVNSEVDNESELVYAPESNWTYEIGVKGHLFDDSVSFAAAVYHVDWTDQQILIFGTGAAASTSITGNIGSSEIDGFELSGNWDATDWLQISFAYNYNDARYTDASTSSLAGFGDCSEFPNLECVGGLTTGRVDGNPLQYTPMHSGTLGIQLTYPAFGDFEYYARTDISASSRFYVDAAKAGYIPGSEQVRLRLGLRSDTLSFTGFCNNLFDDDTPVTGFESRDFFGNPHYYVRAREGRMCGITVAADF